VTDLRFYHSDKPITGIYYYNDLNNGGYAERLANPTGFAGRNKMSMKAIYAKCRK
jgi:hypothetical protein